MSYAFTMLLHERQRFSSAILAVAFSTVLICIQFGLLLGLFSLTSIPIDYSGADIWLGAPGVVSVDVGQPIPENYFARLAAQPEVQSTEAYVLGFQYWTKPKGGVELCIIVGSRLHGDSLGAIKQLTPELRSKLTEPGAVVIDHSEFERLGVEKIGDTAEVFGHRVRIVGEVHGLGSLQGPYVFTSIETAKELLMLKPGQTTYVLAKCSADTDPRKVAERLNDHSRISVLTSEAFSQRSRWHWLTKTKAGIAMGFAAVLALLVGAVVTRQSLYSAIVASIREYAVLRALGIPRWRLAWNITSLAFWIGFAGILLALPLVFGILQIAAYLNLPILLPWWLLTSSIVITWGIAVIAGLSTLNTLQQVEPIILLR